MELIALLAPHTPDLLGSYNSLTQRPLLDSYRAFHSWLTKDHLPLRAIIAFSPGWQTKNILLIDERPELESSIDYSGFGVELRFDPPGDPLIASQIKKGLKEAGIPCGSGIHGIDHGVSVPLFFLDPEGSVPVVPVSQPLNQTRYIRVLGETLRNLDLDGYGRILVLMSGVCAQNEKIMAKGIQNDQLDPYVSLLIRILTDDPVIDPVLVPRKWVDHADPPGRLRELHLLSGLGFSRGRLWGGERALGVAQFLVSFGPVELEKHSSKKSPSGH
ncbi:MAG: DODA-type extradiol aromatic ring-opening family dioxygenase [Leptospirales bacterium]